MTYTPIPAGTLNWDVPVNAAFVDQDNRITANEGAIVTNTADIAALKLDTSFTASDLGFNGWNYDPVTQVAGSIVIAGTVYTTKFLVKQPITVTNLHLAVTAGGVGLTVGQCFAGLYDSNGTLLSATADQSTTWLTSTLKTMPLVTPQPIAPGAYYVATVSNGGTQPTFLRAGGISTAALNGLNTNATVRWGINPTGQTTLPGSITMSSRIQSGLSFWVATS